MTHTRQPLALDLRDHARLSTGADGPVCPTGNGADTITLTAGDDVSTIPPGCVEDATGALDILADVTLQGAWTAGRAMIGQAIAQVFA